MSFIKSPLNYVGGKYKLLPQILPLLPNNIDNFVDLFAGGLNISINVKANKYYINDIIVYLIDLYKYFYNTNYDDVIEIISNRIKEFGLSKDNADAFKIFREYYNTNKNPIDLFILICFSFNHQIRFNNKHEFNNSYGKNIVSFNERMKDNLELFINRLKNMDIIFSNSNFLDFNFNILSEDDFVYCDPPYLITTASYNDGKRGFTGWNEFYENKLLELLDNLNNKNIRFALSNVLKHNGKTNNILLEWSKKYNIHYLISNYNNFNRYKKTVINDTVEVLITNY